jgi:hypothetical protein
MNWFHILVLAFVCVGGPVMISRAFRLDRARADREWSDLREWHLLHGPTAGCVECESK